MNDNKPTQELVRQLVQKTCRLNGPVEEAEKQTIVQLGWDSLEIVTLVVELEETYGIELDIDNLRSDTTLGELMAQILG